MEARFNLFGAPVAAIGAALGPALVTALPSYAGLALLAGILMGPNGMSPADMVDAAASSAPIKAVLWIAWIAAIAPAARQLLLAPETTYLRWLPIRRPLFWAVHAAGLLVLELPWALLWHLGAPPLGGIAAALVAAAAHAALAVRPRGALWLLSSASSLAALIALMLRPAPDWIVAAVALMALAIAVIASWARAAEAPASIRRPRARGGPVRALFIHHGGRLIDAALGGRVVVAATVAGGLAGLFIRVNDLDTGGAITAAAAAGAIGVVGVTARIGTALIDDARELEWIAASCGARPEARVAGLVAAATLGGAIAGAAVGAVTAAITGASLVIAVSSVAAIAVVIVSLVAGRAPDRFRGVRVWALSMAAAAGLALAVAVVGPVGLVVVPAAVLAGFGALSAWA